MYILLYILYADFFFTAQAQTVKKSNPLESYYYYTRTRPSNWGAVLLFSKFWHTILTVSVVHDRECENFEKKSTAPQLMGLMQSFQKWQQALITLD